MKKLTVALLCVFVGVGVYGVDVKTLFIDQPPKSELKGGVFSGLAIDILQGIEKVDPQLHFVNISKTVTPIARVEKALEDGDIDIYVGFAKNAAREKAFNFVLPLFPSSNIFVAAAGETATFKTIDEFKALNKDAAVLAVSNSAAAQYLKKQGIKVDDGSASFSGTFDKLLAGRAKFLYVLNLAAIDYIRTAKLQDKVKLYPTVTGVDDQYFCISKKASPAVVDAVTAALTKMKTSGALAAIIAPYLN